VVPTFTANRSAGEAAQLCPCDIATVTPQAFTVASEMSDLNPPEVANTEVLVRIADQPESTGLELAGD